MRTTLEPAYILHRRPYRDSSLILEVWGARQGRVALVARGARRPRARQAGALQPFRPLLVSWSGRGEMGTLTGVETLGSSVLRGRALISGLYINELLVRLLPRHDPHPPLFDAYGQALRGLGALVAGAPETPDTPDTPGPRGLEVILRRFENVLLRELGYGLVLDRDAVTGAPIRPEAVYDYYPDRGPVPCAGLAPDGPGGGAVRVHGRSLLALAQDDLRDERSLYEAKHLMRAALAQCLGSRPLNSRRLFSGLPGAAETRSWTGEDYGGSG